MRSSEAMPSSFPSRDSERPSQPRSDRSSDAPRWPDFAGRTVVVIATGPSLTAADVETVREAHAAGRCGAVVINDAGVAANLPLAAPWADILYAADRAWWYHCRPDFPGLCVSGEPVPEIRKDGKVTCEAVDTYPLKMLEREEKMPHAIEPAMRDGTMRCASVVSGGFSGFQALGLVLALGAARVILLGYDCGGSPRNCHVDRPEQFKRQTNMAAWARQFDRVPGEWPDVEIINASRSSAISAFPRSTLDEIVL